MENFMVFLTLITSVLCLILFFKIWGMTNNVARLKNKLVDKVVVTDDDAVERDLILNVKKALLKKDQQKAHDLLLDYVVYDLCYRIKNEDKRGELKNVLIIYKALFAKIGEELPENIASLKDFEDVRAVFTWPSPEEVGKEYNDNDPNAFSNYWLCKHY